MAIKALTLFWSVFFSSIWFNWNERVGKPTRGCLVKLMTIALKGLHTRAPTPSPCQLCFPSTRLNAPASLPPPWTPFLIHIDCRTLQELNLKLEEVEALLIDLILDQRLHGKIDQIDGFLLLEDSKQTSSSKKHDALERWSESLRSLTGHVFDRVTW